MGGEKSLPDFFGIDNRRIELYNRAEKVALCGDMASSREKGDFLLQILSLTKNW